MNDFSHLKNKLLAEQIEDQIYHYILDTPIEPGAKLPNEFELGEKFGVGRSVPVTTVVQNYNPRRTSVVLGEQEKVLYGKGFILDTLCGKTYALSPRSFYQVNPVQTAVLYGLAVDAAKLTGNEVVLDAYCGIGTIGLTAADKAKQFIATMIFRESKSYYKPFINELNPHIKTDFSFFLPVDTKGKPDWKYMENYMQSIIKNAELDLRAIQTIF